MPPTQPQAKKQQSNKSKFTYHTADIRQDMIRIILKGVVYNIHKYRTRYNNNLHLPIINLSEFNKEAYFSEKRGFNHLMEYIKNLPNDWKCFTSTLKRFLYQHSFYLIKEYFKYKENRKI